ncbi:MAG: Vi polysaccharide biosynthesis UDP-N-acetylglucosamine C-6 dehydrogenase TviB [Woeseiaceae bacterium]
MNNSKIKSSKNLKIAVIGLGYVGLPLAIEFGKKRNVIGFDINEVRIEELLAGKDLTGEITKEEFSDARFLKYTSVEEDLLSSNCFIITVPTPVDTNMKPDLSPLVYASKIVGKILKPNDIVIYESTVYPGCTEEDCVPILEKFSGLQYNKNTDCETDSSCFYLGYSPERINPGDREHKLVTIKKVTSGSNEEVADLVDELYKEIIVAGTYKAESIRVAEAAKVIENTQRDLNIALVNELAIIFNQIGIDTEQVLKAAETKWNFLPFRPGLVGGHCIGVDPYYLTYKAQSIGYEPEVILAGRRINDSMGVYVASQLVKAMTEKFIDIKNARILLLGFTFKENCSDLRNTRIIDIITELKKYECNVDVYDPIMSNEEAQQIYDIEVVQELKKNTYDGIIISVAHKNFSDMEENAIRELGRKAHVLYDLKYMLGKDESDLRL